ncbi:MAG: hypothetical protein MUE41_13870 [Gemmatimonadaceae bacterium]|nr:hypothetical protein [Gemmatimonadaceae bacterium]
MEHANQPSPVPVVLEPDPVIEAYKPGIDRTLLRENLRLSWEQRLDKLRALQRSAAELAEAGRALRRLR